MIFTRNLNFVNLEYDKTTDSLQRLILDNKIEILSDSITSEKIRYIKANSNEKLSPFFLYTFQNYFLEDSSYKFVDMYQSLSPLQKKSYYGTQCKRIADEYSKSIGSVGEIAFNFSFKNNLGEKSTLHNLTKESYILLNFWASWCAPCRAETGFLKNLKEKYHQKGFNIFAISDDSDEKSWNKAILKDNTQDWIHLDLNSMEIDGQDLDQNIISKSYYIKYLPTLILINKEGKIVGRYDSSHRGLLEEKLESIYK